LDHFAVGISIVIGERPTVVDRAIGGNSRRRVPMWPSAKRHHLIRSFRPPSMRSSSCLAPRGTTNMK
jgi:hypothetical protein